MTDTKESPAEIARKKLAAVIERLETLRPSVDIKTMRPSLDLNDEDTWKEVLACGNDGHPLVTWADLKALATPDTTDKIETGAGGLAYTRLNRVLSAIGEGYPWWVENGHIAVSNPKFVPDNGADPFLTYALSPTGDGGRARENPLRELQALRVQAEVFVKNHARRHEGFFPKGEVVEIAAEFALSQAGAGEQGGGASREGWVLVPREPTLGMVAKGWLAAHRVVTHDRCNHEMLRDAYGAMLDAAQSPTTRGEG